MVPKALDQRKRLVDLFAASMGGKVDVVRPLQELGADVNAKDNDGQTPLHIASVHGKVAVLRPLQELGADVNHAASDAIQRRSS